ncbi:MAG: DUF5979 domain-containing protein, partial [Actinomycetaceae bacterium]|nr:DUF5979 domain-containing protein [Actinomycetaceae bacterium]
MSGSFLKRRLLSLLSVMTTVCLGGAMLHGGFAEAANEDITVTPREAVFSDGGTEIPNRQLDYGGLAMLYFDWTAQNRPNFSTGDQFTINLGKYFDNIEFGPNKKTDMEITHETLGQIKVGECSPTSVDLVTCTFNEKVDELKVSYSGWRGTVKVIVRAMETTSNPTVDVTINNVIASITLPKTPPKGGKPEGIGIKTPDVIPASVYKALTLKEHNKVAEYSIYMSGKILKDYLQDKLVFGDPNQVVKFRDSLVTAQGVVDTKHVFETKEHPTDSNKLVPADPQSWIFRANKLEDKAQSYQLDDLRPGPDNRRKPGTPDEIGSFELNVEFEKANPHVAIISIKGPFSLQYNYSLSYTTKVKNPAGIQEGTVYSNKLELLDSSRVFQLDKSYRANLEATVVATTGFGHFMIEKRIAGTAEQLVTADHKVTVNYTYELPLTADHFPNWTPPGTLNPDKKTGKASCEINFRKSTLCLNKGAKPGDLLPQNSKVFITPQSEDLGTVSEPLRGLNWATPVVELPNPQLGHLVIPGSKSVPRVVITNQADHKVGKFSVSKLVSGIQSETAPLGRFSFKYSCVKGNEPAIEGRITDVVPAGRPVVSPQAFELGTVCTITEEVPQNVPSYSLTLPQPQVITIESETTTKNVVFKNAYKREYGTFKLKKNVTGLGQQMQAGPFSFRYECRFEREPIIDGTVHDVPGNGTEVDAKVQVPVGSTCTINEIPPEPLIEYSLQPPAEQVITIPEKTAPTPVVEFTNVYRKVTAPFAVKKLTTGLAQGVTAGPFDFTYSCKVFGKSQAQTGEITGVVAGGPAKQSTEEFPEGSICTVTEKDTNLKVPGYKEKKAEPVQVVIAATTEPVVEAVFTNEYTQEKGTFGVKKSVTGLPGTVNAGPFDFGYVCSFNNNEVGSGTISGVVPGAADATLATETFPIGTVCTVTEKPATEVPGYMLVVPQAKQVNITDAVNPVEVTFNNVYTKVLARFSITKTLRGLGGEIVPHPYEFAYSCVKAGEAPITGTISGVRGDGPAKVSDKEFPVGSVCTITENTAAAAIKGYTLQPIDPVVVTIAAANLPVVNAEFNNVYTRDMGTFAVQKTVTGLPDTPEPRRFNFTYTCVTGEPIPPVKGEILDVPADGTKVTAKVTLPVGSSCTVTEVVPAPIDGYTLTPPEEQIVKIADAKKPVVVAEFTNAYTKVVAPFAVKKTVSGLDAGVNAGPFDFTYSCVKDNGTPVTGEVTGVTGDGVAKQTAVEFPVGSVCTVTEKAASANVDGYTLKPVAPVMVTIAAADQPVVEAVFANEYSKDLAAFVVKKSVTGLPGTVQAGPFNFTYSCVKGAEPAVTGEVKNVPGDGTEVPVGKKFPVGSVCTVTEVKPADVAGYELAKVDPVVITLDVKDQTFKAEFTNAYTKVVAPFAVKKTVSGLDAGVNAGPFDFTYSCVKDNGTPVTGEITGVEAGKPAKATD